MNLSRGFVAALLLAMSGWANADELFASDETLTFTLTGPFAEMGRDRDKEQQWPGKLEREGMEFQLNLAHRGNRRLAKEVCDYPPLRLDFKKQEIRSTWLEHQNDIKLVVQCGRSDTYQEYLRLEYLIYRMLNLLTPSSYQVRWLQVMYVDSGEKADKPRQAPAFFVERKTRMAKRLGLEKSEVISIPVNQLDAPQSALLTLFQYVIANPDFAFTAGPPGKDCCHNAKLLQKLDGSLLPVIYDFDSSGLINARYAVPAAALPIDKVSQRLYRGYCEHNPNLEKARADLLEKRTQLRALITEDTVLGDRMKKRAGKFLDRSFDNLADDKKYQKEIIRRCR